MTDQPSEATYNLGAILQETGIKADTLRAWERRYGLPLPQRSPGGHRLYTRRDIEMVKWLMARQAEKMSISQAVGLWKSLESEGKDPLRQTPFAEKQVVAPTMVPAAGETISEFRASWVSACKSFDEGRAEAILSQALALYPPETVCLEVLLAGMSQIGEEWYRGSVIVQQEHFASQLATRRLEALVAATPPPTRKVKIVVAAPPTEEHDLVLLLAVLLLRRRSLDVLYLGRNVPLADLEVVVENARPALVISAAQRLNTAAQLGEMARVLLRKGVATHYGGRIFNQLPRLRAMLPAHFLGERFDLLAQVIEEALINPPPSPLVKGLPASDQQALDHFRQKATAIVAQAQRQLAEWPLPPKLFAELTPLALTEIIESALRLGDVELAGYELQWLIGRQPSAGDGPPSLSQFLAVYRQAAEAHLDERGQPLLSWLERFSAEQ